MRARGWWAVAVVLCLGCSRPAERFEDAPVQTFSAGACRVAALPAPRPPPDHPAGYTGWTLSSRRVEHLLHRTLEVDGQAGAGDPRFPAAAGVASATRHGVTRPALYVWGGATARMDLQVPPRGGRLVFFVATAAGQALGRIVVHEGEQHRAVYTSSNRPSALPTWTRRVVDLGPFSDRHVVLELAAQGDGVALFGAMRLLGPRVPERAPNVIVYDLEGLRADHLGAWGAADTRTPNLDRIGVEGARFGEAIAVTSRDGPSIPSLLTARFPTNPPGDGATLQERFAAGGWRTGAFSARDDVTGPGFDVRVGPARWPGSSDGDFVGAASLRGALLAFAREERDTPFFAFVHTVEPAMYARPKYAEGKGTPYDRAVREADAQVAELTETLRAEHLAKDTLIVFLSDRGESLGGHGVHGSGASLYQSEVWVPLVFWSARAIPPLVVDRPVSLVDVGPTLLGLFGLPALPHPDGVDLGPYLAGDAAVIRTHAPSALLPTATGTPPAFSVVRADGIKLIRTGDATQVFDLRADPCEVQTTGAVPVGLRAWLDAWASARSPGSTGAGGGSSPAH